MAFSIFGIARDINSLVAERYNVPVSVTFRMERSPGTAHVDDVVRRHRLDLEPLDDSSVAVLHHNTAFEFLGADFGQHHRRFLGADNLHRFRIEMIAMIVGHQYNVGFRQLAVVGQSCPRVYVDNLAVEREHQRTMPDESDLQIAGGRLDNIRFELLLRNRPERHSHNQRRHHVR